MPTGSGPSPTSSEPPAFDLEAALGFADGSLEFLRELGDKVKLEAAQSLARLAPAVAAGDAETTRQAAHSLKGMLAYVGAGPAREAAAALENAARAGSVATFPALAAVLAREVLRFQAAYDAALGASP